MNDLKQAGTELDGNQRYQTAREELESLLESVIEKDPQSKLITEAEALLSSQTPTPEAFANLKEEPWRTPIPPDRPKKRKGEITIKKKLHDLTCLR